MDKQPVSQLVLHLRVFYGELIGRMLYMDACYILQRVMCWIVELARVPISRSAYDL
jgi:hypothetical protein